MNAADLGKRLVILGACAAMGLSSARAEKPAASPAVPEARSGARVAELETTYWTCDYLASTRGIPPQTSNPCFTVSDELKNAKFGGDFGAMLEWWRRNKAAEHQKAQARLHGM